MGSLHRPGIAVSVLVSNRAIERRACQALARLGIRHSIDADPDANLTILDTGMVEVLGELPVRSIVVCAGNKVADTLLADVAAVGGSLVKASDLRPERLLGAMFAPAYGHEGPALRQYLVARLDNHAHAADLVHVFLESPARNPTLKRVSATLGWPTAHARSVIRRLVWWRNDVSRAEHLWTCLRAETWIWLTGHGIPRRYVEWYLGIVDRTNFRRACRRAGVDAPWDRRGRSPVDVL